ncbi:MAG: GerMN domain-containing protein [Bacillota bacterium]
MKRFVLIAALVILAVATTGCFGLFEKPETAVPGQPNISPNPDGTEVELVLYFGDKNAEYLVAEVRKVIRKDESLEALAIRELIKGPASAQLTRTIPAEAKLLSVSVENGVAYVNFSRELQTKHWGGSSGELMTIYSIVNTLTERSNVQKVQLLLEGKKEESIFGHSVTSEPIERRADLIKK